MALSLAQNARHLFSSQMKFEAYINTNGKLCVRRKDGKKSSIDPNSPTVLVSLGELEADSWNEAEDSFAEKAVALEG